MKKKKKKANTNTTPEDIKKADSKKKSGSNVPFLKSDKFRRIVGLFLVLMSVVLLLSFISYLFNWKKVDTISWSEAFKYIFNKNEEEFSDIGLNPIGLVGTLLSKYVIKNGFGIASFVLVLMFFTFGIKFLLKVAVLPIGKTTRISILALIWISMAFGFVFGESNNLAILGGRFGADTNKWLAQTIGKTGTGILLLFVLLSFLIINFDLKFDFLKNLKIFKKKGDDDLKGANLPLEDKYNTIEYSVEDEEEEDDFFKPEGQPGFTEPLIIVERGAEKNDPVEIISEPEFTIETPVKTEEDFGEILENGNDNPDHKTIDEPYDPWLDLPDYKFPTIDLLEIYGKDQITVQKEELEQNKNRIVETLNNYSIQIQKIKATIGPTVTLYEIIPAPGVRISRIKNLEDDIALSLSALGIRIIAPIPGKGTIGIEVPNQNPDIVSMKSVLSSEKFQNNKYDLPFGIGKTIANESFVADLTKMPHILMAGATGQGKSVGLNAIITSLLYKKHPSELKFIMIDPKKVELTLYSKIERHFLAKLPDSEEAIITDTRKVVRTLNSLSIEMDNRYELLKDAQVRNIKEYNVKFKARKLNPQHGHRFLPYFVLVIDEFADLIMTAGKEIETPITRLAQLARAVGIHLIIATQRPSVNIITGSIKANFPARVAFRVISKIDSRTILDSSGADQLIGRGDMLLSTGSDILRLQCAFVDTPEIDRITEFIGSQRAYPDAYHLPDYQDEESEGIGEFDPNERDELFDDAARIIVQTQQGSTSLLQRKLKLGYNRAGRIIDQLEAAGIVGPFEGSKAREVKVANEMALEQFLRDLGTK
jgi:S-DNA-T family DNA segregation ATPase FtsK/SpoIIIE